MCVIVKSQCDFNTTQPSTLLFPQSSLNLTLHGTFFNSTQFKPRPHTFHSKEKDLAFYFISTTSS